MPYLQLQDQQYPLSAGDASIGAFDGAAVRLPSGDPGTQAVISVGPRGVNIRRGTPDSVVMVNGVQLGLEPSPLLHGDRVQIAGHELRLGDDQKVGSTAFVSAADVAALVAAHSKSSSSPKKATTATGGRLVSLVDGREYAVSDRGVTFGREVGNDVVLASNEVSRKHASIAPAANGYILTDHSTNGVWVNGDRMQGTHLLGRGDVLKMGTDEFRFYADVAKPAPPAEVTTPGPAPAPLPAAPPLAPPPAPPPAPPVAAPVAPAPPPQDPASLADTVPAETPAVPLAAAPRPAAPPPPPPAPVRESPPAPVKEPPPAPAAKPAGRVPLATLEIIAEGPLKGMKFDLHSALTNIGRGEHNDISIRDESISDSHAKLQKRAEGWWIVDQGSTNGTYVGGRRVNGEQRLEGSPDIRFGGIKMTFRPAAAAAGAGGSTRAIAAVNIEQARRSVASKTPALAKAPAPASPEKKKGCGAVIALVVTLVGAGAGLLALLLVVGR